jgi:hypothetical protein
LVVAHINKLWVCADAAADAAADASDIVRKEKIIQICQTKKKS